MANHWEVLELAPGANEADITSAFRKKAHLLHPDKGGSAEEFKQLYKAYEDCMHDAGVIDIDLGEIFADFPHLTDLFNRIGLFGQMSSIASVFEGMSFRFTSATGKPKPKPDRDSNRENNETGGQQNMVNKHSDDPIFGDPLHILDTGLSNDILSLEQEQDAEREEQPKAELLDEAEENGGAGIIDW